MRAKLASLNHCAVPYLSRAVVNLSWYNCTLYKIPSMLSQTIPSSNTHFVRYSRSGTSSVDER